MPTNLQISNNKLQSKFALLGKKLGMTQIFLENGDCVPVTAVEVGPCVVLQKKSVTTDGYSALQLGYDDKKKQRIVKPETGHAAKSKSAVKRFVREVRVDEKALGEVEVGSVLTLDLFQIGDHIDVTGTSLGKGFQGVMKKHNFRGARHSHNHEFFRHGGSIGNRSDPGKVFKNKKMPGQMGNAQVTVQNLVVVGLEKETNTLLVRGAIPGHRDGYLILQGSEKGNFKKRSWAAAPAAEQNA